MHDPIDTDWQLKLDRCKKALEKNNFEVFVAADTHSYENSNVHGLQKPGPNLQHLVYYGKILSNRTH